MQPTRAGQAGGGGYKETTPRARHPCYLPPAGNSKVHFAESASAREKEESFLSTCSLGLASRKILESSVVAFP
jgi:hypothetical protein